MSALTVINRREFHFLQDVRLPVVVDDDSGRVTAVRVVHFDLEVASAAFDQRYPRLVAGQQLAETRVLERQRAAAVVVATLHVDQNAVGDADVRLAELARLSLLRTHVAGDVVEVRDVYVCRRVSLHGLVAVTGEVRSASPVVRRYRRYR